MSIGLRLTDMRRRFGRVKALDGLSLEVPDGSIYGLLGRNGAGKSTTIRILIGLLRADSGSLELFGQTVHQVSVQLKQRIGYVSQEQTFYPWMNAVQLGAFVSSFYPRWDQAEYQALLRTLDVPPDRRAGELSGGTRTKLGLALALGPRPDLLLLDEPTAGLDPVARREFSDMVAHAAKQRGTTVLFSSHLVDEVERLATRVGIIQAGRARFEGEVSTLVASVRRVVGEVDLPPGFERVRGDVWQATPTAWEDLAWPAGCRSETLSLEEIFLAIARTDGLMS